MTATELPRTGPVVALRFEHGALWALDQTLLPARELDLELQGAREVAAAIKRLAIRGAPLIGVAAAYGVALELARAGPGSLDGACRTLRESRPTAANLEHAVERVRAAAVAVDSSAMADAALSQARTIHAEEEAASEAMAVHGADLLTGAGRILTHCNTGALAAPGRGTALAVVAELAERGSLKRVIATETRPLLQGARLTVYELARLGIPHELIVDSAAPGLITRGAVDAVVVGCDRVAADGDVANKIGTLGLALAAHAAGIPFVVVGPTSTIDHSCATGAEISIEQRDPAEVRGIEAQTLITIAGTSCRNPAFDVTPAPLVTALVTERGVAQPVDRGAIAALP